MYDDYFEAVKHLEKMPLVDVLEILEIRDSETLIDMLADDYALYDGCVEKRLIEFGLLRGEEEC